MNTARRSSLLVLVALFALLGCAKGGTSIDQDLTKAAGGPLGADEDLCGNKKIDEDEDEECDGAKLGRATCESLGFSAGGVLACDPQTCIYDTSMCRLPPVQTNTGGSGG